MLIELAQKRQDPVPGLTLHSTSPHTETQHHTQHMSISHPGLLYSADASADDPFDQVNNNGGRPHLKSTNELRGLAGGEIEEPPQSYSPPSPDAFSRPEQQEQEVSPSTFPVGETQSEPDTGPSLTETSTLEEAPPAPVSPTDIEPLSPHTSVEEPESTGSEVATTSPTPLSLAPTSPTPTPSSPETATPKPRKQSSPPAPANNSVKLGLGDFIFYSLLVSKAALTGWVAFASCFCVVICVRTTRPCVYVLCACPISVHYTSSCVLCRA